MNATRDRITVLEALAPATTVDPPGLTTARVVCDELIAQEAPAYLAIPPRRLAFVTPRRLALVGAAASALTVAGVVVPNLTDQPAFASWTPTPQTVTGSEATAAAEHCRDTVMQVVTRRESVDGPASPTPIDEMSAVLVEQRGDYTFTILADNQRLMTCMKAPIGGGASSTELDGPTAALAATGIDVLGYSERSDPRDGTFTTLQGRVRADVVSVHVTQSDGHLIHASLANGYYAAWWPGSRDSAATITVGFADGSTSTGPLPLEALNTATREGQGLTAPGLSQ